MIRSATTHVHSQRRPKRLGGWGRGVIVVALTAVATLVATLMTPQFYANAGTTAVSTIYETATNAANGSTAASSDAPGGRQTGTAKPGDTLKWVVPYQNNTGAPATVDVKADMRQGSSGFASGTYVPGSLELPPNQNASSTLTPQYGINGIWSTGTPPANANGVGFTGTVVPQGTQQLSNPFPSPSGTTLATVGGDGYNAVVRGNLTYAVFHHTSGNIVYCAQQDGSTCPGWPTNRNAQYWATTPGTPIGTGATPQLGTAWQNGTWISGNKLFWLMGTWDNSSTGTACLDLSTATPTSCGYTVLTTNPISNIQWAHIGSSGIPASNGNIYAVASGGLSGGTGTYSYVCITPSTGASCGSLQIMSGVTSVQAPQATTFGNRVFASVQQTSTSSWQTFCYVAGGTLCTGNWPVTSSTSAALGGNVYAPVLSTTGTLTGVCTIANGVGSTAACWDLSGNPTVNPYNGTGAFYNVTSNTSGDVFQSGTKVYVSIGNQITCRDFALWSGSGTVPACAGFTNPTNNRNYTVRSATSIAPNCLVADSDSGQITFFNAITGGGCLGTSGPSTMTVTPQTYYCGSGAAGYTGWGTLSLPGLVNGTYTNATVTLRDQNNAVIAGFNNITLNPGETRSLAAIPTSVTSITATVTVNGVNDPSGVASGQISISWVGGPPELCFQTIAPPVSCDAAAPVRVWSFATATTTSSAGTDAPAGNGSGGSSAANQADFLVQADPSQCTLDITKTPSVSSARPGDPVTYTITVRNTGSQAYDTVSFTDDLTDVLQDANFNNDQTASTGTVSYTAPNLTWSGSLAAGATATITYSATVKKPDTGDHRMVNTVVSPTAGSNCAAGSSDAACTATVPISDLRMTKTADSGAVQTPAHAGDIVTYHFSAQNTGQTTLTGVVITDTHPGLSALTYTWPSPANPGRLLAGETVTATATYALTQQDVDGGLVRNAASTTGNPPSGPPITAPPVGVNVPLTQGADLALTKSANTSGIADPAAAGNVIEYTFVATNTGNVTMTNVSVTDQLAGLSPLSYTWPGEPGVLEPGQSAIATATYQLTAADIAAGHVANVAIVTGTPPGGPSIPGRSAQVDTPLARGSYPAVSG